MDHEQACFAIYGHIIDTPAPGALRLRENSYLICDGNRIIGVYPTLPEQYQGIRVDRFENRLILPGMVDLHLHAPQYTFRGMGMDWDLIDWLKLQAFPEEAKFSSLDYADRAYTMFAAQMRRSATTRACIFATRHRAATALLMERMEQSGLVSYVGKVNMDRESPEPLREPGAEASIADTRRWLEDSAGRYRRTMPILTPRFIPSCSDRLLEALGALRRAYALPVQSHLSESTDEISWVRTLCPDAAFYGDAYDRYGLFGGSGGGKTIMAHCVWSCAEEVDRMRVNGVYIAHCPASNTNLASGIAPIRSYLEKRLHLGLGTDVAGGQTESVFRAVTDAIQVSKLYYRLVDQSKAPVTFAEALYLATRGGGEFFGQVGCFEPGFELDAIVLDDDKLPHPQELALDLRVERAFYLGLDAVGLCGKYVAGMRLF